MDLVKGENLAEATREGPLPPRRAAELVAKVAEAVQHAHQEGRTCIAISNPRMCCWTHKTSRT
jgi:hypothetical protein